MLDCTIAYGLTFLFPTEDKAVGASLKLHGEFARVELDLLVELASTGGGAMIDVGANIGSIALPFASRRPDWRVVAIEAHRGLSGLLHANSLNNRLLNVDVVHAAAGDERSIVDFPAVPFSDKRNFGALGFTTETDAKEPILMLPLDQIAPPNTRLVKVDVEGFEPEVLKGASALIRSHAAVWLVEATIQHPQAAATSIRTFMEAGYSVHWLYAPFATPKSEKGSPTEPGVGDSNIVALPPGVPNHWNLTSVVSPDDKRPGATSAYPYLKRYGYE
jgi:FkbM family methyltransferase